MRTGAGAGPLVRAYAHAVNTSSMPVRWVSRFIEGAVTFEAAFDGFATEREFRDYLDAYARPAVPAFVGLRYEGGPNEERAAGRRRFVEAARRVDFPADLVPGPRPMIATLGESMAHRLAAVERAGVKAPREDTGYGLVVPLRTLLRARRARTLA